MEEMLCKNELNSLTETLQVSKQIMNKVEGFNNVPTINNYNQIPNKDVIHQETYQPKKIDYSKSKLPKAIVEAITKDDSFNSMLDVYSNNMSVKQTQEPVYQPNNLNQNIDYKYIEFLIKQCLDEKLNNINTTNDNNCVKQIRIKDGGDIRFVTEDGSVYDAKLEYKGKTKKKV